MSWWSRERKRGGAPVEKRSEEGREDADTVHEGGACEAVVDGEYFGERRQGLVGIVGGVVVGGAVDGRREQGVGGGGGGGRGSVWRYTDGRGFWDGFGVVDCFDGADGLLVCMYEG